MRIRFKSGGICYSNVNSNSNQNYINSRSCRTTKSICVCMWTASKTNAVHLSSKQMDSAFLILYQRNLNNWLRAAFVRKCAEKKSHQAKWFEALKSLHNLFIKLKIALRNAQSVWRRFRWHSLIYMFRWLWDIVRSIAVGKFWVRNLYFNN